MWALLSTSMGPLFPRSCMKSNAFLSVMWQAWLLKCHKDHSGEHTHMWRDKRDLGKWDVDCRREGKDAEWGCQGSSGVKGTTEERSRSRWWANKMRREDMSRPEGRKSVLTETESWYNNTRMEEYLQRGKLEKESWYSLIHMNSNWLAQ